MRVVRVWMVMTAAAAAAVRCRRCATAAAAAAVRDGLLLALHADSNACDMAHSDAGE